MGKTAFYDPYINAFIPEQKQPKKIQQLNELGEVIEIDDPNDKPLVEYTQEEIEGFFALMEQGYTMKPADDGTVQMIPPAPKTDEQLRAEYENRVNELIRARYSISQEFAIMRQQTDKPDEYAEYYAYCEQCKATAKAEIYGG